MMAALAIAAWALTAAPAVSAEGRGFAVIVSQGVPVEALTRDELHRIMTFKRTHWKSGQAINLLLPGSSLPARTFLLRNVYRMSEKELRQFILQAIFQAQIDFAPKVVEAERDAVAFVASGRSAIAIVSSEAPNSEMVRVLRIDGRLPGEAGYSLR